MVVRLIAGSLLVHVQYPLLVIPPSRDTSQVIVHRYGSDSVNEDAGFGILALTGAVLI